MFFESTLNAADLFEENRLLHLVLRTFGLRASDPEIYKQLIRAVVPDDGSFPPYDENALPDNRIGEAEKKVRYTMPRRFTGPYLPDCAIAQAWECSADEYGNQAPCPPCASPDWDARCDRCTYCEGGLSIENIWDVMEDMSVRIAHLTAEVFRLTAGAYRDEYPHEAADPASPLYDDLLFTTETCFPAYREMLRNRFHGQDLMSSDDYRRSIWSLVRGEDDSRYGPMQFLAWRKRRFCKNQTGQAFLPGQDAAEEYADEELRGFLAKVFPDFCC